MRTVTGIKFDLKGVCFVFLEVIETKKHMPIIQWNGLTMILLTHTSQLNETKNGGY